MMSWTRMMGGAAIAVLLGSTAHGQDAPAKLRIATEGAYAPWNFTDSSGRVIGFEPELIVDLCARMKAQCEVVTQDWDGMIPALQARKFDAIMATLGVTADREKVIDFSNVYADGPSGWGVLKDSDLAELAGTGEAINLDRSADDFQSRVRDWMPLLRGKTIGVQGSTVYAAFIDRYFKDAAEIREYKTAEQMGLDLTAGRIDAIFASLPVLEATRQKPEFADMLIAGSTVVGSELGRGIAVGLRKGSDPTRVMFNEAIEGAVADGTVRDLSLKWFKVDVTPQR